MGLQLLLYYNDIISSFCFFSYQKYLKYSCSRKCDQCFKQGKNSGPHDIISFDSKVVHHISMTFYPSLSTISVDDKSLFLLSSSGCSSNAMLALPLPSI